MTRTHKLMATVAGATLVVAAFLAVPALAAPGAAPGTCENPAGCQLFQTKTVMPSPRTSSPDAEDPKQPPCLTCATKAPTASPTPALPSCE